MPNVRILGNNFLFSNKSLEEFNIPGDVIMGLHCLQNNENLRNVVEELNNNKRR